MDRPRQTRIKRVENGQEKSKQERKTEQTVKQAITFAKH